MLLSLLVSSFLYAQTTSVKDIPVGEDSETTISVRKGAKATEKVWEIVKEEADVSGDPDVLVAKARLSWRTACSDWKKEVRELNTDNKVLALNCGKVECTKNSMTESICTSKATYTLKVKVN
jgi:hypothetical protein